MRGMRAENLLLAKGVMSKFIWRKYKPKAIIVLKFFFCSGQRHLGIYPLTLKYSLDKSKNNLNFYFNKKKILIAQSVYFFQSCMYTYRLRFK